MADLSFYIGFIGNIISVLVFLSPISTFWRVIKEGSTEEFESLPYICTLLNACLWTYYGLTKPGEYLVATVNGFGIVVEVVYVILFLVYAPKKMKKKTAILVVILDIAFFGAILLITQLAFEGDTRINATGLVCAALNIIMYGSPLAAMRTVVTTKSVEYMPFLLSFFLTINGGVWAFYAYLMEDFFVGIPNGTGFILGITQLILYAMYRNRKQPSKDGYDKLENGSQHEHLIQSLEGSNTNNVA